MESRSRDSSFPLSISAILSSRDCSRKRRRSTVFTTKAPSPFPADRVIFSLSRARSIATTSSRLFAANGAAISMLISSPVSAPNVYGFSVPFSRTLENWSHIWRLGIHSLPCRPGKHDLAAYRNSRQVV